MIKKYTCKMKRPCGVYHELLTELHSSAFRYHPNICHLLKCSITQMLPCGGGTNWPSLKPFLKIWSAGTWSLAAYGTGWARIDGTTMIYSSAPERAFLLRGSFISLLLTSNGMHKIWQLLLTHKKRKILSLVIGDARNEETTKRRSCVEKQAWNCNNAIIQ